MYFSNPSYRLRIIIRLCAISLLVLKFIHPTNSLAKEANQDTHKRMQVNLDDPTMPPHLRAKAPSTKKRRLLFYDWSVESTLVSPSRRAAVIDGQYVAEGDSYQQVRLLEIAPMYLTLEYQGNTYRLHLNKKRVTHEIGNP
ncbi:MAG TPA: hypothetical protein DCZ03_10970 [Gammaproteobacteria bacterium]|nr:hypothetical protein [Gammaproteobacteria bacterium]